VAKRTGSGKGATRRGATSRKSRQAEALRELTDGAADGPAALLRLAIAVGTTQPQGRSARRAAERAYLREARRLRLRAEAASGGEAEELDRAAREAFSRAVLAHNLPKIVGEDGVGERLLKLKSARPERDVTPAQPSAVAAPALLGPPTAVVAIPGPTFADVTWTAPAVGVPDQYVVTPFLNGAAKPATTVPGSATNARAANLAAGTYFFTVQARQAALTADSVPSNAVAVGASPTSFAPVLPPLSSDPAVLLDPLAAPKRLLTTEASELARKWRYEHLKAQATKAAQDALGYEQQIAQLMAMNLQKVSTGELLLNDVIMQVADTLQEDAQTIRALADSDEVTKLIGEVGDRLAKALFLQRFLTFLAETSPIGFWIGLLDALVDDVASFGGGLDSTKRFLRKVFAGDLLPGFGGQVNDLVAGIKTGIDAEVTRITAPLRDAVAELVADVSAEMSNVLDSFDEPLLMKASPGIGLPDVPNVSPLAGFFEEIEEQVEVVAAQIKTRILAVLNDPGDLFVAVAVTFLVLPILAFLVISLAGGPFSAAALVAVLLLAAEELLHLIARWLTGGLQDKLGDLRKQLADKLQVLNGLFARQAELLEIGSPENKLKILADELRELKNLLPEAFLEDAAALLDEARSVVLDGAIQLALGAEQALGQEAGTAFDAISYRYDTGLTPAPQMPGGSERTRLAGAALLRDIGRLERQQTQLLDGKDLEVTHRLSLVDLLGGNPASPLTTSGRFAGFKSTGEVVVGLRQADLTDRSFPGLYRALLGDVRVTAVFDPAAAGGRFVTGIPVTLTHLGESRTRIKRSANPAAPPLDLPDCPGLRLTPAAFAQEALKDLGAVIQGTVGDVLDRHVPAAGPNCQPIRAALEALREELKDIQQQLDRRDLPPRERSRLINELKNVNQAIGQRQKQLEACLAAQPAELTFFEIPPAIQRALMAVVPEALANRVESLGCGIVEAAGVRAAAEARLAALDFAAFVPNCKLGPPVKCPTRAQVLAATAPLADRLANGDPIVFDPTFRAIRRFPGGGLPDVLRHNGLKQVIQAAFAAALARFRERIAKWGDAFVEEDPDPHVRALGFATLVRRTAQESAVFNLFATESVLPTGGPLATPEAPAPVGALSSLQYRPFENRGVEGRILVQVPPAAAGSLVDLILDVTLRGCHDEALADTVRSSTRQSTASDTLAAAFGGLTILKPTEHVGTGNLRTVHYSLRGHRDKTLLAWIAAASTFQAKNGQPPPAPFPPLAGLVPLDPDSPYVPLPFGDSSTFTVAMRQAAPTVNELLELANLLVITPADLGVIAGLLPAPGGLTLGVPELVGIGLGVIPTKEGVRQVSTANPSVETDPLQMTLGVDPVLEPLISPVTSGSFPRFAITTPPPTGAAPTVRLTDLFAGEGASLTLGIGHAVTAAPALLYDVILSLTYRTAVAEALTSVGQAA
jgi:hypothetical protein